MSSWKWKHGWWLQHVTTICWPVHSPVFRLRCINFGNIHAQVKNLGCANHQGEPMGPTHGYINLKMCFSLESSGYSYSEPMEPIHAWLCKDDSSFDSSLFLARCSKPRTFYSKPIPKNKAKAKAVASENQKLDESWNSWLYAAFVLVWPGPAFQQSSCQNHSCGKLYWSSYTFKPFHLVVCCWCCWNQTGHFDGSLRCKENVWHLIRAMDPFHGVVP